MNPIGTTTRRDPTSRGRCRSWSIWTSSGRRIIYSLVAHRRRRSASRCFFIEPALRVHHPTDAAAAACRPEADLHGADRSLHASYLKIALMAGLILASPVVMLAGLALHRARPLLAREEAGDSLRADVVDPLRRRRGLRALRRVSDRLEVLRQLHRRLPDVHAARRAGVLPCTCGWSSALGLTFQMPTIVLFLARHGNRSRRAS